jgi:hypothetical protein
VPGASAFFGGGVVCYSGASKRTLLGLEQPRAARSFSFSPVYFIGDSQYNTNRGGMSAWL